MSLPSTLPYRWAMWVPISFLWSHVGFPPSLHLILSGFSRSVSSLKWFCLQKAYLLPSLDLTPFFACSFQEGIQCCSVKVTLQERQSTCPSNVCLRPHKCPIRFLGDSVLSQSITNVSGQDNDALDWNCALWSAGLAEMAIPGVGVRECLHCHACQSRMSVSSTCSACPGSLSLLQLLPRAAHRAGTAGFSPAPAAGAWCCAMQDFMLCSETVAPVCIQHTCSAMKKQSGF